MMKKLLILAGKPIGSYEIVEHAREQGVYTIVTDYLPKEQSIAKTIADEIWDISTADVDALCEKIIENEVDGIYTGVHEFNIEKMIEICEKLNLPCFCNLQQWKMLSNKKLFKNLCNENKIPTTKEYKLQDLDKKSFQSEFPVIVKPADGSGSRGFSKCYNLDELKNAYDKAMEYSESKEILIEKYMDYTKSVIINYTLVDGEIYFSGISDKQSKKVFENGAPIMSIQFYPSLYEKEYLEKLNAKAIKMFKQIGLKNGVIWIEAFCDNGDFTFNEMGYRFGGSLTYFPVEYLYGINQLAMQIEYALTGKNEIVNVQNKIGAKEKVYCILPVHVKPGIILREEGFDNLVKNKQVVKIVKVHNVGDSIQAWGSAQQVYAYIHFVANSRNEAECFVDYVIEKLHVYNNANENILFNLYKGKKYD